MSVTHGGGRARNFDWSVKHGQLRIQSESGMRHSYTLEEVLTIIHSLHTAFSENWIPLANNVEKMYSDTERPGLGTTIYQLRPGDTVHAQGASYLGVVLEEVGVFEWNGESRGISWRLQNIVDDIKSLDALLNEG